LLGAVQFASAIGLVHAQARAQAPAPAGGTSGAAAVPAAVPQAAPAPYAYPPPYYYYPSYPVYAPPPYLVADPPRWKPGEPAPPGYHTETRPDWKTIVSGSVLLGTFWTVSVVTAGALNGHEHSNDGNHVEPGDWNILCVPVVGPFLAMRYVDTQDAGWDLLLLDGILQSVGALGIVSGSLGGQEQLVRNDAALTHRLRLAPAFTRHLAGVSVAGAL